MDKTGESRHFHGGRYNDDSHRQHGNNSQFHYGTQVVARGEQQPDRQNRGDEAITCQQKR